MRFTKMHGLGNDFIVIDERVMNCAVDASRAVRLCDRRLGIGADGVVLVRPSDTADIQMFIYNSDGSVAEMCGNAIRCFSKYVYERGIVAKPSFAIETLAGIKRAELALEGSSVTAVRVDMGEPHFERADIPMTGSGRCKLQTITALGSEFICSAVNTGVPHIVVFINEMSEQDICRFGPALEVHPLFPRKANVNFARVLDSAHIEVRTWERGCGRTLACGTGSCATAVCACEAGYVGRSVDILLQHGSLNIHWAENGHMFMSGPAAVAFEGECDLS